MTASKALTLAALACSITALLAGNGFAQPGAPARPTVSPYVNLLRQGNSPTLNYYGLVRPEVNSRQEAQALQSATSANQRTIGDLLNGGGALPSTGTASGFLTHRSYFMTQGGGSGGGARR